MLLMEVASGRLDDAEWWWEYGLDGIVGGLVSALVAGAATALAVFLTLRHERSHREAVALQDAMAALGAAAVSCDIELVEGEATREALMPLRREMLASLLLAMARSRKIDPALYTLLHAVSDDQPAAPQAEEDDAAF